MIFQGSHRGAKKGCGRRVGCVGDVAKVHEGSGLRRTGLAQQEKEWWRVGTWCVRGVKAQRGRGILGNQTSNEDMGNRGFAG